MSDVFSFFGFPRFHFSSSLSVFLFCRSSCSCFRSLFSSSFVTIFITAVFFFYYQKPTSQYFLSLMPTLLSILFHLR